MTFLISMPGGAEWIIIIFFLLILLAIPAIAIIMFTNNQSLKKQVKTLTEEKNALLEKLLDEK